MRPEKIDKKYVIAAIENSHKLNIDALNAKHGNSDSVRYPVLWEGTQYPAKTLLNEAIELHNLDHPEDPVVGSFRGGFKAPNGMSRVLAKIGFDIFDRRTGQLINLSGRIEKHREQSQERAMHHPLNQIFYGPPGTGKTYSTVKAAVDIVDPEFASVNKSRSDIKARFDQLVDRGDVKFVTFHQSFSYEDFVEGIRADVDDEGRIRYIVADGIFKQICEAASVKITREQVSDIDITGRRVWKMSLGNATGSDSYIFDECIRSNVALLGYGNRLDFQGCTSRQDILDVFKAGQVDLGPDSYSVTAVNAFVNLMRVGDIVVVSEGNLKLRAIGEVIGDYRIADRPDASDDYVQSRAMRWLRVYKPALMAERVLDGQFSQRTLYELRAPVLRTSSLQGLLSADDAVARHQTGHFVEGEKVGSYSVMRSSSDVLKLLKPGPGNKVLELGGELIEKLVGYVRSGAISVADIRGKTAMSKLKDSSLDPHIVNGYANVLGPVVQKIVSGNVSSPKHMPERAGAKVLVIDEINRGNVSRIFGELISLVEPSKRAGADEALQVTLPYSKTSFSVPDNLYIIGTMNTADRSLAAMDVALRRRFSFVEMLPDATALADIVIEGVSVQQLFELLNKRIAALLGREHCLGHAYFIPLKSNRSVDALATAFKGQIMPLLQEYFFDDWQKIALVLNDHRKSPANRFIVEDQSDAEALFGSGHDVVGSLARWQINVEAFDRIESYQGIISEDASNGAARERRSQTYGGYTIREMESGSIELWQGEKQLQPVLPALRVIGKELGIDQEYESGAPLNTRQLGARIIAAIQVPST